MKLWLDEARERKKKRAFFQLLFCPNENLVVFVFYLNV